MARNFHETGNKWPSGLAGIRPGDFDGGGKWEIAVVRENRVLEVYEGITGALASSQSTGFAQPWGIAVGDVDPAPGDEIMV